MTDSPTDTHAIDLSLTEDMRQTVLMAVLEQLNNYVFPEVAAKIQQDIRDRLAHQGYQDVNSGMQLAATLTAQLQELSSDRNLRVHFSAEALPHLDPHQEPSPEDLERQRHLSSLRNFDFNCIERLRGNVGYLQLLGFEPPEFAGDLAAAAMTLLAHTSALILDLRHNGGGSPAMVALLCSYLFPAYPAIHLNDLYWRPTDSTQQWWTVAHLAGPRYLDKPVFVLTSPQTVSAAEEFAYNLQVHQRAQIVGETTRGGANPGAGYRLNDHFWMFIPTGRAINPVTQSNWDSTGVIPDVKVPMELALKAAHLLALTQLLETSPAGAYRRELLESAQAVERELNQQRQDLISQLGVKS